MKTLYIMRHAKSSWENTGQPDFERGLNERGKRDAPRMGKRLKEKDIHPDLILCSAAKRTVSTARRIGETLNYPKERIKELPDLYHAHEEMILSVIQNLNDKYTTVLLIGHNPGLTDFVKTLMDQEGKIDNAPTCGVVAFKLLVPTWKDACWGCGKVLFFDYPKAEKT